MIGKLTDVAARNQGFKTELFAYPVAYGKPNGMFYLFRFVSYVSDNVNGIFYFESLLATGRSPGDVYLYLPAYWWLPYNIA